MDSDPSLVYGDLVEYTFASSLCHFINAAKLTNIWTVTRVYVDHVELTFDSGLCHLINEAYQCMDSDPSIR